MSDSVLPHRLAVHQTPLSLGFSRQEYWSGLPFPSPMHESEKWKWSRSVVSDSSQPHRLQPTRLLHPWGFPGKSTGVGCRLWLGNSSYSNESTYQIDAVLGVKSFLFTFISLTLGGPWLYIIRLLGRHSEFFDSSPLMYIGLLGHSVVIGYDLHRTSWIWTLGTS